MIQGVEERMQWLSKYGGLLIECRYTESLVSREWRAWLEYGGRRPRFAARSKNLDETLGKLITSVLSYQEGMNDDGEPVHYEGFTPGDS